MHARRRGFLFLCCMLHIAIFLIVLDYNSPFSVRATLSMFERTCRCRFMSSGRVPSALSLPVPSSCYFSVDPSSVARLADRAVLKDALPCYYLLQNPSIQLFKTDNRVFQRYLSCMFSGHMSLFTLMLCSMGYSLANDSVV